MVAQGLFGELPEQSGPKPKAGVGAPRLWEPERETIELRAMCLDGLIGADHTARLIWAYVLRLDLRELEDEIKAREGVPGHPAITPRLLMALWLYAMSEGVASARLLARLCERDDAYRWLCGGINPNHRTLGEFRVGLHQQFGPRPGPADAGEDRRHLRHAAGTASDRRRLYQNDNIEWAHAANIAMHCPMPSR